MQCASVVINSLNSVLFLQSPGPLAEITFWRERASTLTALSDQLKQPVVKKILAVITKAHSHVLHDLEETIAELTKYRMESEDNSRFLSTLERHFMVRFLQLFLPKVIHTVLE